MDILGIDPGTARIGWALVQGESYAPRARLYGCITTDKGQSPERRLLTIYQEIKKIIRDQHPACLAIEELFFATNAKTVIPVAQARGVILLAAAGSGIPVVSYSPLAVKATITGDGKADKKQIEHMIMRILKLPTPPKPDDTCDAIAIALTHAYSYKMKGVS